MSQVTTSADLPAVTHRLGRHAKRLGFVILLALSLAAAALIWLEVTKTLQHAEPVPVSKRPPVSAVVWSERVFSSQPTLERWLERRGRSYSEWAHKHPGAAKILTPRRR